MLKKLMMASLAVGALALNAPVANADHHTYDCGFNTVAQETATGGQDTFTGGAYGYIAAAGDSVSIRCFVQVDGNEASSTPTGSGTSFAATAGQVTYTAPDGADVKLCAEVSSSHGTAVDCFETDRFQIPPQEVIDAIDAVFDILIMVAEEVDAALAPVFDALTQAEKDFVDPNVCPVLVGLAGSYGAVVINGQGDIFIDGEPFWDCPPYDLFG